MNRSESYSSICLFAVCWSIYGSVCFLFVGSIFVSSSVVCMLIVLYFIFVYWWIVCKSKLVTNFLVHFELSSSLSERRRLYFFSHSLPILSGLYPEYRRLDAISGRIGRWNICMEERGGVPTKRWRD